MAGAMPKKALEYVFQDLHNIPDGYEVPEGRVKPWGTGTFLCVINLLQK